MAFSVIVEHTKNKHSRAVVKHNSIVVRLAKNLSAKQQQVHTQELVKRLQNKIKSAPPRKRITPFTQVTPNQMSYIPLTNGHTFTVELQSGQRNYSKLVAPYEAKVINANRSQKDIQKLLWKLLSTSSTEFFTSTVTLLNTQTYSVHVERVEVSHRLSKWGSMSSTGVIHLNPALLFVPEHLRTYVIIHELAHGLEQNHSPKFWAHVERMLPNYKQYIKELRGYALQ